MDEKKFTLITNIDTATLRHTPQIRLNINALVIEHNVEDFFNKGKFNVRVRGFGSDAAWEVFSVWLTPDNLPFKIVSAEDSSKVMLTGGKLTPLFSGGIITFPGAELALFLNRSNSEHVLDVQEMTGDITRVWGALKALTERYWTAPYILDVDSRPATTSLYRAKYASER
jgi:hypothetical protein